MKKLLTILLSILIVSTIGTVNVFAEEPITGFYVKSCWEDDGELKYGDPESTEIHYSIQEDAQFCLFYNNGDGEVPVALANTTKGGNTNAIFSDTEVVNMLYAYSDVFDDSFTLTYNQETITFVCSELPWLGLYKDNIRNKNNYVIDLDITRTENTNIQKNYYLIFGGINNNVTTDKLHIKYDGQESYASDATFTKEDNYIENDNECTVFKLSFDTVPLESFALCFNTYEILHFNYNKGPQLYARRYFSGEDRYDGYAEKGESAVYSINSNDNFAIFYGLSYKENVNTNERIDINDLTITNTANTKIETANNFISPYSEISNKSFTITYTKEQLNNTITFTSVLPDFALYTTETKSDSTYVSYIDKDSQTKTYYFIFDDFRNITADKLSVKYFNDEPVNVTFGEMITNYGCKIIPITFNSKIVDSFNIIYNGNDHLANVEYGKREQAGGFDFGNLETKTFNTGAVIYPKNLTIDDNSLTTINNKYSNKKVLIYVNTNLKSTNDKLIYHDGYYFTDYAKTEFRLFDVTDVDLSKINSFEGISVLNNDLDSPITFTTSLGASYPEVMAELDLCTYDGNNNRYIINQYVRGTNQQSVNNAFDYSSDTDYNLSLTIKTTRTGDFFTTRILKEPAKESTLPGKTTIGIGELETYFEDYLYKNNTVVKLANGEYNYNKDIILRHYGNTGHFDADDYSNDILLDLNGSTITFDEGASLKIEGNSIIHICNGTIKGSGDAVIDSYGVISLNNVKVINTNETNENSYAIKQHATRMTTDSLTYFEGYNGILFTSAAFREEREAGFMLLGASVNATGGIGINIINDKNDEDGYDLTLFAGNGSSYVDIAKNSQDTTIPLTTITAKTIGINTVGKADISISGRNCNDTYNNNRQITMITTINAPQPIVLSDGELSINSNTKVYASGTTNSCIRVAQNNDSNAKTSINLDVSNDCIFESDGYFITKDSGCNTLKKLSISISYNLSNSYIKYATGLANFAAKDVPCEIIAGLYSSNDVNDYIDTNTYKTESEQINSSTYYKVVAKSGFGVQENFTWDNDKTEAENIEILQNMMKEVYPLSIDIKTDINPTSQYTVEIKNKKNINVQDHTIENIKFVVNTGSIDKQVSIYNGTFKNSTNSIFVIENSYLFNNEITATTADENNNPLILINNGRYENVETTIDAYGDAIQLNSPTYGFVNIRGTVESRNGVAIHANCDNTSKQTNNTNTIILEKSDSGHVGEVVGGILIEDNTRVNIAYGSVVNINGAAIKSINAGSIQLEKNATLIGTIAAIEVTNGNDVAIHGGSYTGQSVFLIHKTNNTSENFYVENDVKLFAINDGTILKVVDANNHELTEDFDRNRIILGGFSNMPITKNQFPNLTDIINNGTVNEGMRLCILYDDPQTNDYPFAVVYKYNNLGNVASVNQNSERQVTVYDNNTLIGLKDNLSNDEWAVLVSDNTVLKDNETIDGLEDKNIKEYYDISVNSIQSSTVTSINETKDYQVMTISGNSYMNINYENLNNIQMYHIHGNEAPSAMKKISSEDGRAMLSGNYPKEECYFVEGSNIYIITRRFSTFAPAYNTSPVVSQCVHVFTEGFIVDTKATPTEKGSMSKHCTRDNCEAKNEVTEFDYVVTTPTGFEAIYGDKLSDIDLTDLDSTNGTWSINEQDLTVSVGDAGNTTIKLKFVPNDTEKYEDGYYDPVALVVGKADSTLTTVPTAKTNLSYTGEAIELVNAGSTTSGTVKYKLGSGGTYSENIPTATNAGKYEIFYKVEGDNNHNDTQEVSISGIEIAKAKVNPSAPTMGKYAEGTKLNTINLPMYYSWINPTDEIGETNLAKYHINDNYEEAIINIPLTITKTVEIGGSNVDVELKTNVNSDEENKEVYNIENSAISNSVIELLSGNTTEVKTDLSPVEQQELQEMVSSGESLIIEMSVDVQETNYTEEEIDDFKEQLGLKDSDNILSFVEIEITMTIKTNSNPDGVTFGMTELKDKVVLSAKLPEGSPTKSNDKDKVLQYFVVRDHQGKKTILPATLKEDGTISFESDEFSTYAIGYKYVNKEVDNDTEDDYDSPSPIKVVKTGIEK